MAINEADLSDKILGCWIGKNCGGTLGEPLERIYSQEEPFNIDYYPRIQEGGIPNDDLEIQLVWLKVLEDIGLDFTSQDLAEYWLEHVRYNPDEYGMMKTNLRLGLQPPLAGFYNNFFKDCMGCPIRTEIWACIAAGHPNIAAEFALRDSIVDHAGGESISGSLFNVSIQAAAFVVSDREKLLEIGLSYIPAESLTARCIHAAINAWKSGMSWLEAREEVTKVGFSPIAQYSPPNIAFQVIGWLYAKDFGEAICTAVNCGYDTDCTGATLGSILGIIGGAGSLPDRWTAPLGDGIATSDPYGVKNMYNTPNPAPRTLEELKMRILRLNRLVNARYGAPVGDVATLFAKPYILESAKQSPTKVPFTLSAKLAVAVDLKSGPQIGANSEKQVDIEISHGFCSDTDTLVFITAPDLWTVEPPVSHAVLTPGQTYRCSFVISSPGRSHLLNSNKLLLSVEPKNRPATTPIPITIIGSPTYLRSQIFPSAAAESGTALDTLHPPEILSGSFLDRDGREGSWQSVDSYGNDLTPCLGDFQKGTTYLRGFVHCENPRLVYVHISANVPVKAWLNGEITLVSHEAQIIRPAAFMGNDGLRGRFSFLKGWNEILIKLSSAGDDQPPQCHLMYSDPDTQYSGYTDMLWARFPWDDLDPEMGVLEESLAGTDNLSSAFTR